MPLHWNRKAVSENLPPAKVPTAPREVQDWAYAAGDGVGVTVGSSAGSFAFRGFDPVVVRLYDIEGTPGAVRVRVPAPIGGAERTDLLERNGKSRGIRGDEVEVGVGSYAIETIRVRCRR